MTNTAQITVTARDMYAAQGVKLDSDIRAALVAKANRFRELTNTTAETSITLPVIDFGGAHIGNLTYMM